MGRVYSEIILFYCLLICLKIVGYMSNSVDSDNMLHSAAYYQSLHCLHGHVCPSTFGKYCSFINCLYLHVSKVLVDMNRYFMACPPAEIPTICTSALSGQDLCSPSGSIHIFIEYTFPLHVCIKMYGCWYL